MNRLLTGASLVNLPSKIMQHIFKQQIRRKVYRKVDKNIVNIKSHSNEKNRIDPLNKLGPLHMYLQNKCAYPQNKCKKILPITS